MKNKINKKAFTLIELVVVISLISLAASIVLVGVSNARKKAQVARVASDLRQITTAISQSFQEKGQYTNACNGGYGLGDSLNVVAYGSYIKWPKSPWNTIYTFYNDTGNTRPFGVLVQAIPAEQAQMVDKMLDDGNLSTGMIISKGGTTNLDLYYGSLDPNGTMTLVSCGGPSM